MCLRYPTEYLSFIFLNGVWQDVPVKTSRTSITEDEIKAQRRLWSRTANTRSESIIDSVYATFQINCSTQRSEPETHSADMQQRHQEQQATRVSSPADTVTGWRAEERAAHMKQPSGVKRTPCPLEHPLSGAPEAVWIRIFYLPAGRKGGVLCVKTHMVTMTRSGWRFQYKAWRQLV